MNDNAIAMKIIILGSSAEFSLPRLSKGELIPTPVELSRDSKDRRTRASIAVQFPDRDDYLVIDCTPDYWYQVARANIENKVKALVLTSSKPHHADGVYQHYLPVMTFAHRVIWEDLLEAKIPKSHRKEIDKPIIHLHGLQIFVFDVWHNVENYEQRTFGVRIFEEATNTSLVYLPDLMKIPPRSRRLVEKADLLILDGSTYEKMYNEHRPIRQWLNYCEGVLQPANVWFSGIGYDTLIHRELEHEVKQKYEKSGICYDGLQLEVVGQQVKKYGEAK